MQRPVKVTFITADGLISTASVVDSDCDNYPLFPLFWKRPIFKTMSLAIEPSKEECEPIQVRTYYLSELVRDQWGDVTKAVYEEQV